MKLFGKLTEQPFLLMIFLLVTIDLTWLIVSGISVTYASLLLMVIIVSSILALSLIYTGFRPDKRIANITKIAAQLLSYSACAAVFSCLVATLRAPLIDNWLDAADKAAGFNWVAYYAWVENHKAIHLVLDTAYQSLMVQIGIIVIVMTTLKRYDRTEALLGSYIIASLVCILISAFLPAAGAFGHYQVALETPYVQQFYALRNGEMKTLNLFRLEGIVQFPSFHLALAIICPYVARGIRFLFPLLIVLNFLVILATPVIGGHFFADLWCGALVTGLSIFFVHGLPKRSMICWVFEQKDKK